MCKTDHRRPSDGVAAAGAARLIAARRHHPQSSTVPHVVTADRRAAADRAAGTRDAPRDWVRNSPLAPRLLVRGRARSYPTLTKTRAGPIASMCSAARPNHTKVILLPDPSACADESHRA